MIPPLTRKQAEKLKYNWGVRQHVYIATRCAWECFLEGQNWQCSRKPGHGPDKLYCRQHAKMVERQVYRAVLVAATAKYNKPMVETALALAKELDKAGQDPSMLFAAMVDEIEGADFARKAGNL